MMKAIARGLGRGAKTIGIGWASLALLSLSVHPRTGAAAEWPDTFVSRVEALALMQTLNAELLSSDSATLTLERWCADHRLSGAAPPTIIARMVNRGAEPASPEQRQRLQVGPTEEI